MSCLSCLSCLSVTSVYCGQMVGRIKMKLGTRVGLGSRHTVLDGDPAPSPQRGRAPNFWPISVVAKWLDGSRCHLVWREASTQATLCYMGTQLHPQGAEPPVFGRCLLWPNGWMDQDVTWYEGRSRPRHIVLHEDPAAPKKGTVPQFSAHVYCGQPVAHLSYC